MDEKESIEALKKRVNRKTKIALAIFVVASLGLGTPSSRRSNRKKTEALHTWKTILEMLLQRLQRKKDRNL